MSGGGREESGGQSPLEPPGGGEGAMVHGTLVEAAVCSVLERVRLRVQGHTQMEVPGELC